MFFMGIILAIRGSIYSCVGVHVHGLTCTVSCRLMGVEDVRVPRARDKVSKTLVTATAAPENNRCSGVFSRTLLHCLPVRDKPAMVVVCTCLQNYVTK